MIKVYQLNTLQNNYIISVPFKGVKVRCEFKDGNIAKGIHARLFTNDPFKQRAIESCPLHGKTWKLVETVKEESDEEPAQQQEKKAPAAPAPVTEPTADATPTQEPTEPADGDNKMEFANLGEAVMYVATTYNQQVETDAQVRKVLKDNGITAVIHKG